MSTFTTVQTMNKHMSVASLSESLADLSLPPPPAPSTAPYHFTASEMAAFRATRALLVSRGVSADRLSAHEIAITTMNQKLRTDDAADKYMAWLDAINVFGLKSFDEVKGDWSDFNSTLAPMFQSYSPCGRDASGRDIFWINGSRPVKVEEEREAVRAGCLYFLAIHSDPVSLRNGITFVIDVGHNRPNVGNEKKMQKVWQAFPLRPQRILIAGAGTVRSIARAKPSAARMKVPLAARSPKSQSSRSPLRVG